MSLGKQHVAIVRILLEGDDVVGMLSQEMQKQLGTQMAARLLIPLDRLCELGYAETRWQGEPWKGERHAPDDLVKGDEPMRYYRITDKGRRAFNR
jgi:hypothetical protein